MADLPPDPLTTWRAGLVLAAFAAGGIWVGACAPIFTWFGK